MTSTPIFTGIRVLPGHQQGRYPALPSKTSILARSSLTLPGNRWPERSSVIVIDAGPIAVEVAFVSAPEATIIEAAVCRAS